MKSLFSIFNETNNSFEGQEHGEKVIVIIRRHPFFIVVRLLGIIILFLLPLLAISFFNQFLITYGILTFSIFIYSLWSLLLWQILFYFITMYILDIWIVTDRRIIDSTQHGFFDRSVSELHITKIQDISVKVEGFFQTLLKFGDLSVQTAGTETKFHFLQIPKPKEVKDKIMSNVYIDNSTVCAVNSTKI